jgi:hypothetical protein
VLLQLLPLQAEMVARVERSEMTGATLNILSGAVSLWGHDVPELVRVQLLRTAHETLTAFFFLAEEEKKNLETSAFLPPLRDVLSDATRRPGTASEALNVLATLALRSPADRAEVGPWFFFFFLGF